MPHVLEAPRDGIPQSHPCGADGRRAADATAFAPVAALAGEAAALPDETGEARQ